MLMLTGGSTLKAKPCVVSNCATAWPILSPFMVMMHYLRPVIWKGFEHDSCSCSQVAALWKPNFMLSVTLQPLDQFCHHQRLSPVNWKGFEHDSWSCSQVAPLWKPNLVLSLTLQHRFCRLSQRWCPTRVTWFEKVLSTAHAHAYKWQQYRDLFFLKQLAAGHFMKCISTSAFLSFLAGW